MDNTIYDNATRETEKALGRAISETDANWRKFQKNRFLQGWTIYLESKNKETDLRKKLEELKNGVSLQAKN